SNRYPASDTSIAEFSRSAWAASCDRAIASNRLVVQLLPSLHAPHRADWAIHSERFATGRDQPRARPAVAAAAADRRIRRSREPTAACGYRSAADAVWRAVGAPGVSRIARTSAH